MATNNPFKEIAQPAIQAREDALRARLAQLDGDNYELGVRIADWLSACYEQVQADDDQPFEKQIIAAEQLNQLLQQALDHLQGESTASAAGLTDEEHQLLADHHEGKLKLETEEVEGEDEPLMAWRDVRFPALSRVRRDKRQADNPRPQPSTGQAQGSGQPPVSRPTPADVPPRKQPDQRKQQGGRRVTDDSVSSATPSPPAAPTAQTAPPSGGSGADTSRGDSFIKSTPSQPKGGAHAAPTDDESPLGNVVSGVRSAFDKLTGRQDQGSDSR